MSKDSIQDSVTNVRNILSEMDADSVADLIADIMHYCDAEDQNFQIAVRRAKGYYKDELADMAQDLTDEELYLARLANLT